MVCVAHVCVGGRERCVGGGVTGVCVDAGGGSRDCLLCVMPIVGFWLLLWAYLCSRTCGVLDSASTVCLALLLMPKTHMYI